MISLGIEWLKRTQNDDGGWGDTTDSPSNLSTSLLVQAALTLGQKPENAEGAPERLEVYLQRFAGETDAQRRQAICAAYHPDRTFAVPILTNLALAGLAPWEGIPPLPFELAALPPALFRFLRLHVVSYALPALIAVGMALDHHRPTRNLLRRWIRSAVADRCLKKLEVIQPGSGGFLEAVPLTSFVAMTLMPVVGSGHPVAMAGLNFLRDAVRPDGSWPIDSDLSVWVTTAAVAALSERDGVPDGAATRDWILGAQHLRRHPYTQSAPGAWAWTDRSGGVPDADDTAGAILALMSLGERGTSIDAAVQWLLDLQNADGGWPTFCRGWGHLPFDRSAADITAHVLRALQAWDPRSAHRRCGHARRRGLQYLKEKMRADGSWHALWFGSQSTPDHANPVVGTSRVLRALALFEPDGHCFQQGMKFLLRSQNADGGWGAESGAPSTVEETALALSALVGEHAGETRAAVDRGTAFLVARIDGDNWPTPAPIGLYFARLWYGEDAYPLIWTVEALGRVLTQTGARQSLSGRERANARVPSGG